MDKSEEFLKKDLLIKKYSNKPIPKFLKFLGKIKELDGYEGWLKAQEVVILKWIGGYLIILPFFVFFCLSALGISSPPMKTILLAEGSSLAWYLLLSLIKDIKEAIRC